MHALNGLRAGHRLYARLTRPGEGVIVGGEYLPALPGSVLSVLRAPDQGASVVPLRDAPVWSAELATDHAISGARRLRLQVGMNRERCCVIGDQWLIEGVFAVSLTRD